MQYLKSVHKIALLKFSLLMILLLMVLCNTAYATPPSPVDGASFENTSAGFQHFYQNLIPFVDKVVNDSSIANFSMTLWKFFTVLIIVWELAQGVFEGFDFTRLFSAVFVISVVRILMLNYDSMTSALWSWSEGLSSSIQMAAVGVGDEFFAPRYIWNLFTSFSWSAENLLLHPLNVVAAITLALASAVISILAFFAVSWALWGYSLAKIIGLSFIPTMLFERLSWLFDGWLRFFFGFLIYNIVAKASLMLVILSLSAYFVLPADVVPQHIGYQLIFNTLTDVLGLLVFISLSIVGLMFTGSFVKSLVSGSHVGSIVSGTQSLHGMAKQGARMIHGMLK